MKRALVILLIVLACMGRSHAQVKMQLFDWLTGNDATLHQQLIEFFKIDPSKLPTLTPLTEGVGFRLENPGGAPSAICWSPFDLDRAGLYTLRFEARWEGDGEHGRATASLADARLDYEPGRQWAPHALTTRQSGPIGTSSLSFSLRGRHGRLEVRGVDIVRSNFDIRVVADPMLRLQVVGRAPGEATLEYEGGSVRLGDLTWTESDGVASAPLPAVKAAWYDWHIQFEGRTLIVGNRVRLQPLVTPPHHAAAVTIRADGTLIVDGRPWFGMGLYLHEGSVEAVKRAAESGVNLVLLNDTAEARNAAAAARSQGMQVIIETNLDAEGTAEERVKRIVDRYGNQPLLAWTAVDEPDLKPAYNERVLREVYTDFARLDGRPLYQANHSPQSFWTLGTQCDVLAVDPYPLGAVPRPMSTVGTWIDEARAALGPGRSVWLVQQAFAEAPFWPRPPTVDQLHAMTWIGLIHGARGIVYYTVHEILDPATPDHKWDLRKTPLWKEIARETAEVKGLTSFLVAPGGPRRLPTGGPFDAALWDDGHGNVLLAIVNLSENEAEAVLGLPAPAPHDLRVYPDGPVLQPSGGFFAVRLAGCGVLLLRGKK